MLFRIKDEKAKKLEAQLNKLQKDGPAAWAKLPEDELFTPAGFRSEQAEATGYSNYSYWGSTFRAFFKNKLAVVLLVALIAVVAFAFFQPHLPGQVDPNLCEVDPATGVQYRNIAPGEMGFIWGSNAIGQDLWARIWAGARTSLIIGVLRGPRRRPLVGITRRCAVGLCPPAGFLLYRAVQHLRTTFPPTIILILISYVASAQRQDADPRHVPSRAGSTMARFIRNQILIIRDRDYNVASRCIGTPTSRIVAAQPAALPGVSVIMLRDGLDHPRRHRQ